VRGLIYQLLVRIGRAHPQSLMYPLLVAAKSQSGARREAAWAVLDHIRQHSPTLVEQAQVCVWGGGEGVEDVRGWEGGPECSCGAAASEAALPQLVGAGAGGRREGGGEAELQPGTCTPA
jgi:phosphatidylinositol kinase/protein kinase (PI-3  family)